MAAPNFTASRLGVANLTSDGSWAQDNNLFLQVWAGEVLTAFNQANVFQDLVTTRTIANGKSASFPLIGLNSASYHTPGQMIVGNQMKHAEAVVKIDDKLVSSAFVADIDEAKNHFDVRAPYSKQMGLALAYTYDKNVAAMVAKAARTASGINTDLPGGTRIKIVAASKTAITGAQLATALFSAAQKMDENNLPEDDRYCVLAPAEYYKLVQETNVINRLWGGQGAYADGTVLKVAGISILKSNHLPTTNRTATTGEQNDYTANFTDSVALAFSPNAVGVVKLMDLKMESTGSDVHALWQGTFMVASMALGVGILRPDCAVEIYTATS